MTVECVLCGNGFASALELAEHECVKRPLVNSPDEWKWRTHDADGNVKPVRMRAR